MTLAQIILDALLVLLGVLASRFVFTSLIKPSHTATRIFSYLVGAALCGFFYLTWANTGLDPVQWTICASYEQFPACAHRKIRTLQAEPPEAPPSIPEDELEARARRVNERDRKNPNLWASLKSAEEIADVSTRDVELGQVFTASLNAMDPDAALAAAAKISTQPERTERLILLICWAVALDRSSLADQAIALIHDPSSRDRGLSALARAAAIPPKSRRAEADCGRP